jgi:hypothetical protein
MSSDSQKQEKSYEVDFSCVAEFWRLGDGRDNMKVVIGDSPDFRTAEDSFEDRILNNRPSQWHTRYPSGYIRVERTRKLFDLEDGTIDGNKRYIFPFGKVGMEFLMQHARRAIIDRMNSAQREDWITLNRIVLDEIPVVEEFEAEHRWFLTTPWNYGASAVREAVIRNLRGLGLAQLQMLLACLEVPVRLSEQPDAA